MKILQAPRSLPPAEVAALEGKFLGPDSYDLLLTAEGGPATVLLPGCATLLKWLPGVLTQAACAGAYDALRTVNAEASNRGTAAGYKAGNKILRDGTRSKTKRVPDEVLDGPLKGAVSGVIGAFERNSARFPVCRLTAFNINEPERFGRATPFFQEVDGVFRENMRERWEAQRDRIRATHPAWVISGTVFTTVTVNKNFRTAVHTDAGDLPAGFGVMSALRAGKFTGGYTVFPQWGVAVDMSTGGVLLADVHQWHGNTEIVGKKGQYERLSVVLYYRKNMYRCGSPEEEMEHGKRRKAGDPIWPEGTK